MQGAFPFLISTLQNEEGDTYPNHILTD